MPPFCRFFGNTGPTLCGRQRHRPTMWKARVLHQAAAITGAPAIATARCIARAGRNEEGTGGRGQTPCARPRQPVALDAQWSGPVDDVHGGRAEAARPEHQIRAGCVWSSRRRHLVGPDRRPAAALGLRNDGQRLRRSVAANDRCGDRDGRGHRQGQVGLPGDGQRQLARRLRPRQLGILGCLKPGARSEFSAAPGSPPPRPHSPDRPRIRIAYHDPASHRRVQYRTARTARANGGRIRRANASFRVGSYLARLRWRAVLAATALKSVSAAPPQPTRVRHTRLQCVAGARQRAIPGACRGSLDVGIVPTRRRRLFVCRLTNNAFARALRKAPAPHRRTPRSSPTNDLAILAASPHGPATCCAFGVADAAARRACVTF